MDSFTNYALHCRVPTEDHKPYYWENMQKLFSIFDPLFRTCGTARILADQHFQKVRWDNKQHCNRVSGSRAPTGGAVQWSKDNLERISTLYLNDRTFHDNIWNHEQDGIVRPMAKPPLNSRGYAYHYSTTIIANLEKLKPIASTDWYNRVTDFRFQIPYHFRQFPGINLTLEFCVRDDWLTSSQTEAVVHEVAKLNFCVAIFKRENIASPAFSQTYDRVFSDRPEDKELWMRLR